MGLTTQRNFRILLYVNTFIIVVFGAVIAGAGVFFLFPSNIGEGYHNALAAVQAVRKILFWRVAAIYAVISLCIGFAIMVLHVFYSHRIAGPAYRVSLEAAKIAQGNLTGNIMFRRKDNLMDMKDLLNDMTSQYRERITTIGNSLSAVETKAGAVSDLIREGKNSASLKGAAAELAKSLKDLEQGLSDIRT